MNILRIIPAREDRDWVELLFQEGPHNRGNAPNYPLTFPMPSTLREDVTDGYLYVVYDAAIIGYAKIANVQPHSGAIVGREKNPVRSGDTIILAGPLKAMPYKLACRAFRPFRYTSTALHLVGQEAAEAELEARNLFSAK